MGSCISKCSSGRRRRKKKFEEVNDSSHVQDKLVIVLDRVEIPKISPEKPISSTPSSSFSYSKCTIPSSSSSSSSSTSSSALSLCSSSVKDKTFTNEFLQSCVKENPRVIRLSPVINKTSTVVATNASKIHPPNPDLSTYLVNRSFQQTTLKKRARSRSPSALARQKSFRRDLNTTYNSIPNRGGMRSPSPSRRFNADNARSVPTYESPKKGFNARSVPTYESPRRGFNADNARGVRVHESPRRGRTMNGGGNYAMKKEIFQSPVRDNNLKKMKHELSERVSRKIDEKCSREEMEVDMEEIHNPHIALDCFIFL